MAMVAQQMPLDLELQTYKKRLPELASSEGKFVLVHRDEIAGVYDSYQDALKAGYEKFQLSLFLVKRISSLDTVYYFTRDVGLK